MTPQMHRLQISLPKAQANFLRELARREGVSAAEFIRRLLKREGWLVFQQFADKNWISR